MGLTKITSQNLASGIDPILLGSGTVDFSKLDYLKNVTSDIQTQIDSIGGGPGGGDGNLASYTGSPGLFTYISSTGNYLGRTLIANSNKIEIVNNNGVSGNPTFDIIESNIQLNALSGIANTSSGFWFQSTSGAGVTPRLLNSGDITFQIDASYLADGSINNNTFQNLSGTSSNIQTQLNDKIVNANTRLLKGLEQYKRCFSSPFTAFANAVTTNNQAYFVFLGRTPEEKIIKNVNFTINTSGRGTQTAEVGLFSTSLPPCSSGLIFTKLVYSDGVTDMLGGSPKVCKNITGFVNNSGYLVASGIYLWAGYRVSMVTTQPNVRQISAVDNGRGFVQIQASAPRFSGNIAGWSGTIQAASVTTLGPYLSANMD